MHHLLIDFRRKSVILIHLCGIVKVLIIGSEGQSAGGDIEHLAGTFPGSLCVADGTRWCRECGRYVFEYKGGIDRDFS